MMVASLENCKRLYELSGWDDTYLVYNTANGKVTPLFAKELMHRDDYPAYDLGYLLRKLPPIITLKSRAGGRWSAQLIRGQLVYNPQEQKDEIKKWEVERTADTPEDAAVLLCIKLIEQGVL